MDIISFHPLASLLLIDCTPHKRETCLLTFILGEIVTIFAAGRIAETSLADFPEFEKLFNLNYSELNAIWQKARKDLGYADKKFYTIHLCRHTCASRLVQRGVPILLVKDWLGHEDIEITMIYAPLQPTALHSYVEVLN